MANETALVQGGGMGGLAVERAGDWGCTFTGAQYWPEDPRAEDIRIEDIAHALANQCRFGGHCREFYSVAQHAVLVSRECDPADALWGLLHDASEAYIVDIPRPLKYARGMEGYKGIEDAFMGAVCERFGLAPEVPASVRRADEVILATEARDLMPPASVAKWTLLYPPKAGLYVAPWSPRRAKESFLLRFHQLAES